MMRAYTHDQLQVYLDALCAKVERYRERCLPVCGQPPNFVNVDALIAERERDRLDLRWHRIGAAVGVVLGIAPFLMLALVRVS